MEQHNAKRAVVSRGGLLEARAVLKPAPTMAEAKYRRFMGYEGKEKGRSVERPYESEERVVGSRMSEVRSQLPPCAAR
jgi:hypothetical protein